MYFGVWTCIFKVYCIRLDSRIEYDVFKHWKPENVWTDGTDRHLPYLNAAYTEQAGNKQRHWTKDRKRNSKVEKSVL